MIRFSLPARPWYGCDILVVSPTPTHPQDHGNRKRIFEICAELKRQGARIHFVHYPAEHDWRHDRPISAEREMIATWDSYQLIAPTRAVHQDPIGIDHLIDEWADPDIGHYISWVCRTQSIDVVLVNYTWMSFCFEYVPDGIFKICDTHDVFGGRRELLERNGVAPEFFHTTPDEEARGLARADLVWAIKASEQQYYENELGLANCLTVLHAEPERQWWTGPPSTDGWLRAGVIGARNNVNRQNLEHFLRDALPIIENYMAPVKIVIAGGCADEFKNLKHPNVEVLGRVADLGDFYSAVDVVIAPMKFSTGLKIKVSEALASGAPLLALAHATEGYPTTEQLHLSPDFKAMAFELVKLGFDCRELPTLAARSREICANIRQIVLTALEETRRRLIAFKQNSLCVVVPMAAFDEHSLLYDHLVSTIDYFRHLAPLRLYVIGPAAKADPNFFSRFDQKIKVFAAPQLMAELGGKARESWTAMHFRDLVETWRVRRAYFMCDDETEIRPGAGQLSLVLVRHDAVELSGGNPAGLIDAVSGSARVTVIGSTIKRAMTWRSHYGIDAVIQVGFRRVGRFHSLDVVEDEAVPVRLVILGKRADSLAQQTFQLGARLGCRSIIFDEDDADAVRILIHGPTAGEAPISINRASLIVDLTGESCLSTIFGEAAQRAGIPVIRLLRGRTASNLHSYVSPIFPTSIGRLLRTVAQGVRDPVYNEMLRSVTRKDLSSRSAADAGWTWLWHLLSGSNHVGDDYATSTARLFS